MSNYRQGRLAKYFVGAWITAFGVGAALDTSPSAAADKALRKVNVAHSSISGNMAPLWVTQEKGFFRKYGLDVHMALIETEKAAATALTAGDISFAQVGGPAVIQSRLRGADTVVVAGVINTLTFQLFTDKAISRPDQFKGKVLGVTRFGSTTDFALRYALEKYRLDAAKDLTLLELGNAPALLAAMEAGRIQGAMLSAPSSLKAKKLGFPMLADLQMLGLEFQHTGIATARATINSRPDLVREFIRAYIEGIHYAKTHRKDTMEVLAKYMPTAAQDMLEDIYDSIVLSLIPEKPYPSLKGVQIILRELGLKDTVARSARPEQFVDLSIVKEFDKSGFIDALYKAGPRPAPVAAPAPKEEIAPVVVAEAKIKPLPVEEKIRPVAKQVAAPLEKPSVPVPAPKAAAQQYTVKAGDTLSKIAVRFYNSIDKWEKIYAANRESLKSPDYIFVGMKLVIPADR